MKYQNGRQASASVFQAVRYISKVGVMTKKTWLELLGTGTYRWKVKQLNILINGKVLKKHSSEVANEVYALSSQGLEMVHSQKWSYVHQVNAQFIIHDEVVANGLWRTEQASFCSKWMTERELKSQNAKSFKLDIREGQVKYPDSVFKFEGKKSSAIVALEYERHAKSSWRYNKAIKAYSNSGEFDYVLFIVENLGIMRCIKRAMRFIGDVKLNSKIGFILVDDWKKNPVTAPIQDWKNAKSLIELSNEI